MCNSDKTAPYIPTVEQSSVVFDEFVKVRKDTLRLACGTLYPYYTIATRPSAVAIVATTPEGLFVLNREYRHPTNTTLLSCPGGYLDEEEDPLIGAQRELLEETGYHSPRWELLGSAYPYPGMTGQKIYYALASDIEQVAEPRREPAEFIECMLASEQQLAAMARAGKQLDATLCAALWFYQLKIRS